MILNPYEMKIVASHPDCPITERCFEGKIDDVEGMSISKSCKYYISIKDGGQSRCIYKGEKK